VSEAAEVYRKNEDRIGLFLSEETREAAGATVTVKALFAVYRVWSEERGERPMTQIAFHRKLSDRAMQVVGSGASAVVDGRALTPRSVPTGEVDWGVVNRFAK
jgi:phage/plasmid-associated DNA primase